MYIVVGSGPAGIACTRGLVNAGHCVTILDAGLGLEAERELIRASTANKPKIEWTEQEIAVLKTPIIGGQVPQKRVCGSDYPYRTVSGAADIRYGDLSIRASHAQGGFSNVWGGAVLPYRAEDMADWPITREALAEGYSEVAKYLPIAAQSDCLEAFFPLPREHAPALERSRQIKNLFCNTVRSQTALNRAGVFAGQSRLAVSSGKERCIYCGFCLHGCPRDLIYSSRQSLGKLLATGKVTYAPGVTIRSFSETGDKIELQGVDGDGRSCRFEGARAFLAAGTISSTVIVLRSLQMYDEPVYFKDSQYYLFPLLQAKAVSKVAKEDLHTLCQAFIEIFDKKISPYTVHLQVYSYNDHLDKMLTHKLGPLKFSFPSETVLGRMLLVQGYLHSLHSGSIRGTLQRAGNADRFILEEVLNPETRQRIALVIKKIWGQALRIGAIPLSVAMHVSEPGRGFHTGGSLPMSRNPKRGETDVLGRPFGMERLHVVDASVFPSIPATTITLPAMANAYRIATAAAKLDPPLNVSFDRGGA